MINDSKSTIVAKVDARKVKYSKPKELGIDFSNEIDVWAKMEFKSRKQIERLRQKNSLDGHNILQDLNSIVYAVREKLDLD
jgi:hypothetical protein